MSSDGARHAKRHGSLSMKLRVFLALSLTGSYSSDTSRAGHRCARPALPVPLPGLYTLDASRAAHRCARPTLPVDSHRLYSGDAPADNLPTLTIGLGLPKLI